MLTGTNTNTQVQASVIGGRESQRDYDLDDISPPGSSPRSYSKEHGSGSDSDKEPFAGIKVTTFVTQESTSSPVPTNGNGSTNEIVRKQSF